MAGTDTRAAPRPESSSHGPASGTNGAAASSGQGASGRDTLGQRTSAQGSSGQGKSARESSLRRLWRRLVASEAELEAEDLQQASAQAGCMPAGACARGSQVVVAGRLRSVVYTPRTNLPTLEAELFDGTGEVTLVWLGRRRIAGIEPGRHLVAKGRVALRDDRKVIYNPYYELEPAGQ